MFCAQCGTSVSNSSRFCVVCGSQVTDPAGVPVAGGVHAHAAAATTPAPAPTVATTVIDGAPQLAIVRHAVAADYAVEREVGRGGMAVVYRAREVELDRPVALKVLPPELVPVPGVADRFKREARLAASLDHPNVIPVYRVGQSGGVLYMAMKFIDGRPLDAVIEANGPLPLPVVLEVLRSAAHALAFAHERGIVHRDIKGANILVDRDGRVVVSDFGIARAVESSSLTATGMMIGTPHFMSPEQCAGKPVGPQSDQYSLGIVAYQMLTGSVPFDGDSIPEILQHHWWTPAPDATTARADAPAALTAIVRRMLAKPPEERFQTTADLAAALDAIRLPGVAEGSGARQLRELVRALTPGETPVPRARATPPTSTPATTSAATAARVGAGDVTVPDARSAPRAAPPVPPRPAAPPRSGSSPIGQGTTRRLDAPAANGAGTTGSAPTGGRTAERSATARRPAARPQARPATPRARHGGRWRTVLATVAVLAVLGVAGGAVAQRRAASAATAVPRTALDMRRIGHHAYRAGEYEFARRFFERATVLDSTDGVARAELGCALFRTGHPLEAQQSWKRAGRAADGVCIALAHDVSADTSWLPETAVR